MTNDEDIVVQTPISIPLNVKASAGIEIVRDGKSYVQHTLRLHSENVRVGERIMDSRGNMFAITSLRDSDDVVELMSCTSENITVFPLKRLKEHFLHVIEEPSTES